MNARKKFIITLSALSVFFIIAVMTLVIVLVARLQAAKAVITVKYSASKVSAELSARYILTGETDENGNQIIHDFIVEGSQTQEKVISFGPSVEDVGTLVPGGTEINLSKEYKEIIFEFNIKNTSSTIEINVDTTDFPIRGEEGDKVENVSVKKYDVFSETSMLDTPESIELIKTNMSTMYQGGLQANIKAQQYFKFYLVVQVTDTLYDAEYSGNFTWSLTRADEGV